MPFKFNGTIPEAVKYNANDVQVVKYNGVVVWEKNKKLEQLATGTIVYLMEDAYTPYIVVAHGHHGSGLTTLVRQHTAGYDKFHNSIPSSAYNNRYSSSRLEIVMENLFSALPTSTQALIESASVPVLESASGNAATVTANFFPLSSMELNGSGSNSEGTQIPYFSSNARRIATDGTTARAYWSRSVVTGMNNYAKIVTEEGALSNSAVNVNTYVRPACCVASDFVVTETDGKYYII